MIRISVFITRKQQAELEQLKQSSGLPVAEHIRRAIDEYLKEKRREQDENVWTVGR